MPDDDATTREDARVVAARRLIRQADLLERLRGRGLLMSMLAAASFVAVAGVAPPGWVALTVVLAGAGGYLLVCYHRARLIYRRDFAVATERLALPAAARLHPRRYFDEHGVEHGVPVPVDPLNRLPAPVLALSLLALGLLIRFVL